MLRNNIKIIYNRSEIGAGTRGASLGIDALKIAAVNKENHFFRNTPSVTTKDFNHLLLDAVKHPRAKHIESIIEVYEDVCNKVDQVIKEGQFPLVISGDHSSAGGTIAGVKKAFPDSRVGIVWIDAHADLHSPYTSPTGNVHGMPLATVLNEDNIEMSRGPLDESTQDAWNKLKETGGHTPKANPEDLVFISVRDTEEQEEHLMAKHHIPNYTTDIVRKNGVAQVVKEIKEQHLKDCDVIYITFDVDSMDCDAVSHGTGTPVKNGLFEEEGKALLRAFVEWDKVVALEITEINPLLDEKRNFMAETTLSVLEYALDL